ncbi:MAG: lysostaphin resistance A-like protein [Verrucomicrobiales bacterium]
MSALFKNDLFKIAFYFLSVVALGAALAPPLFFGCKNLAATGLLQGSQWHLVRELGRILGETNIQRYFNRAILAAALLCLIPLIRSLRIKDRSVKDPSRFGRVFGGFAMGAGILLTMGWGFVFTGVFEPRPEAERESLLSIFQTAIVAGVAVGLIEEFFFRGMILGICSRTTRRGLALFFVSALYSAVHFLKPPDQIRIPDAEVMWTTGFWLTGKIFSAFTDPGFLLAEFTTLFAVGWVLGTARLLTGSLWVSIGMHAGFVFSLKTFAALTKRAMPLEQSLPWIGGDLKIGVVPLLAVIATGWLVNLWLRNSPVGAPGGYAAAPGTRGGRRSSLGGSRGSSVSSR